jgi:hypothetical protein
MIFSQQDGLVGYCCCCCWKNHSSHTVFGVRDNNPTARSSSSSITEHADNQWSVVGKGRSTHHDGDCVRGQHIVVVVAVVVVVVAGMARHCLTSSLLAALPLFHVVNDTRYSDTP